MLIGWFPGHMNKARKDIIQALKKVNAVLEVVDARLPYSSENPLLRQLIGDRPVLKILNKSDLADPDITRQWLDYYRDQGRQAIALDKDAQHGLAGRLAGYLGATGTAHAAPSRLLVAGIPNAGKSTLINNLIGRKVARTGNEPAVTRGQQEIRLAGAYVLVDTPGILWPKIEDQDSARRLAITGAIRNTAIESGDIALAAVDFFRNHYTERFLARYGLATADGPATAILEAIGNKRGCLRRGGVDFNKAGDLLLNDIRSGKLGRLSFETPADIPDANEESP